MSPNKGEFTNLPNLDVALVVCAHSNIVCLFFLGCTCILHGQYKTAQQNVYDVFFLDDKALRCFMSYLRHKSSPMNWLYCSTYFFYHDIKL